MTNFDRMIIRNHKIKSDRNLCFDKQNGNVESSTHRNALFITNFIEHAVIGRLEIHTEH